MNIEEKERLARTDDTGLEAMAIRLRAARLVTGLNQMALAAAIGIGKTTLNNAEMGLSAPNRATMSYLYRAHRIDFNFLINGDFAQLPADVQAALFAALPSATSEWGQREHSNQSRTKSSASQS